MFLRFSDNQSVLSYCIIFSTIPERIFTQKYITRDEPDDIEEEETFQHGGGGAEDAAALLACPHGGEGGGEHVARAGGGRHAHSQALLLPPFSLLN